MKIMGFRARLIFAVLIIAVVVSAVYGGVRLALPSNIVVLSGESATLTFNMPLKGELLCKDKAVSAVNDKPVTENIRINMKSPVTIKAENAGKALLRLSFCGIPLKESTIDVLPNKELIPWGKAVGLELNTDGILVLGTGEVRNERGKYVSPCAKSLKSGDLIKKADKVTLTDKESLINYVENSTANEITLTVERKGEIFKAKVTPVLSSESGKRKLGLWVRDSTQGIGTVTCYDKEGNFYALGHPVTDVDTGDKMEIRNGKIMPTSIKEVDMGEKGKPGELMGSTDKDTILGQVYENNYNGIKGRLYNMPSNTEKSCKIALKNQVKEGSAQILVTTKGSNVRAYDINIESTDTLSIDKSKAMVIRITDKDLINETGGIVQGMSGAPILQEGRLVGAVTHVFIQDPAKGYGIYIEDMLKGDS